MDELDSYLLHPQTSRRRPRVRATSVASQPTFRSDGTLKAAHRPHSPIMRPLSSIPTYGLTPILISAYQNKLTRLSCPLLRDSYPEIVAPVPLRHQALQPTPDAWIRTPSPPSTRTISPTTPIRGGFSRASAHYSYASFSTVMETGNPKETPWQEEQGFGRRWLRWMHKNGVRHWIVPCTLLASILVRWCIGLSSYSGTSARNDMRILYV
jgi:hypothetical protein